MSSVRRDWYQTQQKVVIDVLVKNAKDRNCSVNIESDKVLVRGDGISLDLHLAHEIDPVKSSYRILNVKIEVSLQKLVGESWARLEKPNEPPASLVKKSTESYPRKGGKNWDSLVKDIWEKEEIEKEGDDLKNAFASIYNGCDADAQKAMVKSFTESGGTVMSMNWNEVRAGKVKPSPPSGTEFRAWDEKTV